MKSFGKYISKYLISFLSLIVLLALVNVLCFGWMFYATVMRDYGTDAPRQMLNRIETAVSPEGMDQSFAEKLCDSHIWAMYMRPDGTLFWSVDRPRDVPARYTMSDVAVFAKGYISDYPVFTRNTDDGILVLGYPKDSYMKLTENYYSIATVRKLPAAALMILAVDVILLFGFYSLSKRRIISKTGPIIASIQALSDGKVLLLSERGELSEIAGSINKASRILSRQNEARANWIGGVSHDIRTPLSIIMGYAAKLASDSSSDPFTVETATIIERQSRKVKQLVQDLNLVSKLEYEMQPLNMETLRPAKLLRSCAVDILNAGIDDFYGITIAIPPDAEAVFLTGDGRLLARALSNLVQNSMNHNPQGCRITLALETHAGRCLLVVSDDGIGLSEEKIKELQARPHYMESTDERLDLRHGLGLLLVRRIADVHGGSMQIDDKARKGCRIILNLPLERGGQSMPAVK